MSIPDPEPLLPQNHYLLENILPEICFNHRCPISPTCLHIEVGFTPHFWEPNRQHHMFYSVFKVCFLDLGGGGGESSPLKFGWSSGLNFFKLNVVKLHDSSCVCFICLTLLAGIGPFLLFISNTVNQSVFFSKLIGYPTPSKTLQTTKTEGIHFRLIA